MSQITNFARIGSWLLFSAIIGATLIMASAYLYLSPQLPPVEELRDVQLQTPLRIYSTDQKLLGEFGEKRRNPINYDQIPPMFIDALLATEDARFFTHHGVDIKGLLRAVSQLLVTGAIQSGGKHHHHASGKKLLPNPGENFFQENSMKYYSHYKLNKSWKRRKS